MRMKDFFRNLTAKGSFVLPAEVSVQGAIEATIPGRIDGQVRGDVKTSGKLIIGENALIRGNVHAAELVAYGKVHGDIFTTHKAFICNKAYIKGDVNAMVLEIEEGAVIEGAIRKNVAPSTETTGAHTAHPPGEEATAEDTPPAPLLPDEEEKTTSWF